MFQRNVLARLVGASRVKKTEWQQISQFSTTRSNLFPKIEVDGVNLNYEIVGDGDHTVLCSPGLVGTVETDFGKFFDKVDKTQFRWVAWDPPGYGKSRPPDRDFRGNYALKDAHYVAKMMKKLSLDKYSVFGWSQGGATALLLAAEYPQSIINLVTLGTGSCNEERVVRVYDVISNIEYWPKDRLDDMLAVYDKAYLKKMLKDNYRTNSASLNSSAKGEYLTYHADKITCPVLHINGEADTTCPKMHAFGLKQRVKKAKNSRVIIIPNAGHDLHVTHTEEFMDIVGPFFLNER